MRNTRKNRDEVASFIEGFGPTVDIKDVQSEFPNMSKTLDKWARAFIVENGHCIALCICGRMQDARFSGNRKDRMIETGCM